jgi:hypothetical protein
MNQPCAMETRLRHASRKRKKTALSLSHTATPIAMKSDPVNSVATRIDRTTLMTFNTVNTTAHDCTTAFQDNDMLLFGERIVATSLKRRRKELTSPFCHGTKRIPLFNRPHQLLPRYIESDHQVSLPSKITMNQTQLEALPLLSIPSSNTQPQHSLKEQTLPPPHERRVRFASWITVTTIPSTFDIKTTCWYERKDYESFEMDCRQSILAFINLRNKANEAPTSTPSAPQVLVPQQQHSPKEPNGGTELKRNVDENAPHTLVPEPVVAKRTTYYFTIHGLDDFTSVEAKLLRTRRRLEHCYNVLYHQWVLQQMLQQRRNCSTHIGSSSCMDRSRTNTISTEQAILLQQIAQLSSFDSLRLALFRGQSSIVATVR